MSLDEVRRNIAEIKVRAQQGDTEAKYWMGYYLMYSYDMNNWPEGFQWWKQASEEGSGKARAQLGFCYEHGEGCEKDHKMSERSYGEAVPTLREEAAKGDSESQGLLGYMLQKGYGGLERDLAEGIRLIRLAVLQKNTVAQNLLAGSYWLGTEGVEQDFTKCAELYARSAEQGQAAAQYCLGRAYEEGEGVPKDPFKGVFWHRKAAEQNYPNSQCQLGWRYQHGEGVECKNPEKAIYWYTRSANQGLAVAQANLAYCYSEGIGVEKDDLCAVQWYHKAAVQGETVSISTLQQLVKKWKSNLSDISTPNIFRALAFSYEHGSGVEQDMNISKAWLQEATYLEDTPPRPATQQQLEEVTLCVCCEEKAPNTTLIHGGTGHACCCFLCAQICLNNKLCPICRLSIDKVALIMELPPKTNTVCCECVSSLPQSTVIVHGETCHVSPCFQCAQSRKDCGLDCVDCQKIIDGVILQYNL